MFADGAKEFLSGVRIPKEAARTGHSYGGPGW